MDTRRGIGVGRRTLAASSSRITRFALVAFVAAAAFGTPAPAGAALPEDADIDRSGMVDVDDFMRLAQSFLRNPESSEFDAACDINGDGAVDFWDLILLVRSLGQTTSFPLVSGPDIAEEVTGGTHDSGPPSGVPGGPPAGVPGTAAQGPPEHVSERVPEWVKVPGGPPSTPGNPTPPGSPATPGNSDGKDTAGEKSKNKPNG